MWKNYFHLHFIIVIWGFTAILGVSIDMTVLEMVFFRVFISSIGIWIIFALIRRSPYTPFKVLLQMVGTGVIMGLHWFLFFLSARLASVSICLIAMSTIALFTALISPILTNIKLQGHEIITGSFTILGIYIIFRFSGESYHLGLIVGLLSAFLAAIFSVINSKLIQKHDSLVINLYEMMGASLSLFLFLMINALFSQQPPTFSTTWTSWFYICILALVCTVYPFYKLTKLFKIFSPFYVNLNINLELIYGIILAFIFFKEYKMMTSSFYIGTAIIFSSIFIQPILGKKYYRLY